MKLLSYLVIIGLLFIGLSCQNESKNEYGSISELQKSTSDGYVGDQNCTECHKEAAADWKGSHHDKAMQEVNDQTVLGDFDNHSIEIDGVAYLFFKEDGEFHVKVKEIDGSENDYTIRYVFGLTPLQQYLIDFPNGKKQALRATWDTEKNQWFHQYAGDKIAVNDWLHWTRGAQNWNTMCAECHSTNLKKDYMVEKDSFNTTFSSINVNCESCHGPGEKHVNWANGPMTQKDESLFAGIDQPGQLNMCAPCHARRVKLTKNFTPGIDFDDQYLVQNISSDFYHEDGQILEEDYVYGSFLQSKMHSQGIKCGDCHNVHSLELNFSGNQLCLQCHVPADYDSKKHHFHEVATEAGLCINCHMTGRFYMGNDFRRDHSFRIPRPDQSLAYGTPNACNECHDDKSEKWAADWVVKWYGSERKPHFSDYLLLSNQANLSPQDHSKLLTFINDLNYPVIARSTVINNITYNSPEDIGKLLTTLQDSSAVIKYNALLQFRGMNLDDRIAVARMHLKDKSRLVRIACAQLLVDFEGVTWSESDRLALNQAKSEFEEMLYGNADFSTGRLQLGDYFMQTNDLASAIAHYEMSLEKDSLLFPVYSNLATAYSMSNQPERAMETIDTWIELNPDEGRAYYLRGLLNFEFGNNEIAASDLQMAIDLNPTDTRAMYNLATYNYQNKNLTQAEVIIQKALSIDPENAEFQYLLALIFRDQGRTQEAQLLMSKLNS